MASQIPVVVLGLGRIGRHIAYMLQQSGGYRVTGIDQDASVLTQFQQSFPHITIEQNKGTDFTPVLKNQQAVISALGFDANAGVAEAALKTGCSYFDLTEDVACTQAIKKLATAAKAGQYFVPQCGLAPGFVGMLANSLLDAFDQVRSLKLRVGALPEFPANQLMYNLTWSTPGLINEYANPCDAIRNGKLVKVEPLEGRELLTIRGVKYEAFNTSGGLGSLCELLQDSVQDLTYKTIRYCGHCDLMRFLFRDLYLGEPGHRRDMLTEILNTAIAVTRQDLVLISVVATGTKQGVLEQISRTFYLKHDEHNSAIQLATASALCTVLDMVMKPVQPLPVSKGFLPQELLPMRQFLSNGFAQVYQRNELH